MQQSKPASGAVLYAGPSCLDGRPIVVIATGFRRNTKNPKTAGMLQVWILPARANPSKAHRNGDDVSVCGNCLHRLANTCYVHLGKAPLQVYRAWRRGLYPVLSPDEIAGRFAGRLVRLGAYGDPAAVPTELWKRVTCLASGWTAYTHSWRVSDPALKQFCMASCDRASDLERARALGWRTFRVLTDTDTLLADEFLCPASAEAGKRLTCATCLACRGGERRHQVTPAIYAHGGGSNRWKAKRFLAVRRRIDQKKGWRDLTGCE
jgi:hypothetical protein